MTTRHAACSCGQLSFTIEGSPRDGVHWCRSPGAVKMVLKLESQMLLPLDSPHWHDLTACWSAPRAIELLRQIVSMGRLGEAWQELRDDITHQGSVYGVTSAALPHLIRLAPSLTPDEQHDLWIDERPHPHRRPHHRTGQILRALKLTRCGADDISPE